MKPYHEKLRLGGVDLTQCQIHRIVDDDGTARFFLAYPAEWEKTNSTQMAIRSDGVEDELPIYTVTRWARVELEVKS